MLRKTLFLACAALLLSLATSSEAKAWFVYHYGGGYPYVGAYGGPYGGYHYGGYVGGYRYGYVRRW